MPSLPASPSLLHPEPVRIPRAFRLGAMLLSWAISLAQSLAWSPGVGVSTAVGYSVDTANRRDVLSFYNGVYGASEGYQSRAQWVGDVQALVAGTTSLALKTDVQRRVNFYRALAGLPASISLSLDKSAKAQEAALICARNGGLSHYPATEHPGWLGLTANGTLACSNSNLSWGAYGPAAVDGQMKDDGINNKIVGHRRWLLYSRLNEIGTGDIPDSGDYRAGNAVWVIGNEKSSAPPQFVTWPNKGYTPAPLLPNRWSVSYPSADFSSAIVTMTKAGVNVPVSVISKTDNGYADNTLVWEPAGLSGAISADTTYNIQISGIKNASATTYSYAVTLFDPAQLGEIVSISGGATVPQTGGTFSFNSISGADSYELKIARGSAAAWTETAEGASPKITSSTAAGYSVIQKRVVRGGTSAFQLATPDATAASFSDQGLTINRKLVASPNSTLQFYERARFSTLTTTFNAEVSNDDGDTWTAVWSRAGVGNSSLNFDSDWNQHSISLNAYSGQAIQVRFTLKSNGGSILPGSDENFGFFIDDITVSNAVELVDSTTTTLSNSATGFSVNPSTTGGAMALGTTYYAAIAPRVGTRLYPGGPLKSVTVAASAPPTISLQPSPLKVSAGGVAVFRVTAAGDAPLSYQWRHAGIEIPSANTPIYTISGVQSSDAGSYDVIVRNSAGAFITSSIASLSVIEGGAYIDQQPVSASVVPGASYTLQVSVNDPGSVTYQWRKNGTNIPGATGSNYTIPSADSTTSGAYDVLIKNDFGTVSSAPAFVGVTADVTPALKGATYAWYLLAGSPSISGSTNGAGNVALFNFPTDAALDASGNLYVADTENSTIRKVTPAGAVSTIAGLALSTGTLNGSGSTARFDGPKGIAIDASGNLYVADTNNNAVRKISAAGQVTTLGTAVFDAPRKVRVDASGSVYVMDNFTVRKISSSGAVSTLFGDATGNGSSFPLGIALDKDGKLYIAAADSSGVQILRQKTENTFESSSFGPYSSLISGIAIGAGSNIYMTTENSVQLLGDLAAAVPGQPAALLDQSVTPFTPNAVAVDGRGTVYGVDTLSSVIFKGVPSGIPVLLTQPASVTVTGGSAAVLSATATGVEPLSYQWFKGTTAIPNANNPTLTFNAATAADAGSYSLQISNSAGQITSNTANLSIQGAIAITQQPQSVAVNPGASFTLQVAASSTSPLSYQWRKGGVNIQGATSASLRINAASAGDAGEYDVVITNAANASMNSDKAYVSFNTAPVIVVNPSSQSANPGEKLTLTVAAYGTGPLGYQWRKNGIVISGATKSTFSLASVMNSDAASYDVVVSNMVSSVTSSSAKVSVNIAVKIASQPSSIAIQAATPLILKVGAVGTPTITYQWRKNGTLIEGGTAATLSIASAKTSDAGSYVVEVRNALGSETSTPAVVTIVNPVGISAQPEDVTVNPGAPVQFRVTAVGTTPSYQWRKNGEPIAGGTSATYSIAAAQASHAGSYDVVVSNELKTITSIAAKLTVNTPVTITSKPPVKVTANEGTQVVLQVQATGTGPLGYQWKKNGQLISGGTQAAYTISAAAATDAGNYEVVVSNSVQPATAATTLEVVSGRGITVLSKPAADEVIQLLRATNTTLRVAVDPNLPTVDSTTYKLYKYNTQSSPLGEFTGVAGSFSDSGKAEIPLRSLTLTGLYILEFTRTYKDGETKTVLSDRFTLAIQGVEIAAGTYELLLGDSNGLTGDSATYRGVLVATVTKSGSVSGRLLYNEAPHLEAQPPQASPDVSIRAYSPVSRSFSAAFAPSNDAATQMVCSPKVGIGAQAGRQELTLWLDFSTAPVQLNAEVRDFISVPAATDPEGCVSRGYGATATLTKLSAVPVSGQSSTFDLTPVSALRYAISSSSGQTLSTGPSTDNNAYVLVQVLSTGRALWTSRLTGYSGSGSAGLSLSNATDATSLSAAFYEGRIVSSASLLNSTSLLGELQLSKNAATGAWTGRFQKGSAPDSLEKQSSYVSKSNKEAVYNAGFFNALNAKTSNWSAASTIDFSDGNTCSWTSKTGMLGLLPTASATSAGTALYFTVQDPSNTANYTWSILVSSSGIVRTTPLIPGGSTQPALTLRLDRTKGEWSGSYIDASKVRWNIAGATLPNPDAQKPYAQGWTEDAPLPATRTGFWWLSP